MAPSGSEISRRRRLPLVLLVVGDRKLICVVVLSTQEAGRYRTEREESALLGGRRLPV